MLLNRFIKFQVKILRHEEAIKDKKSNRFKMLNLKKSIFLLGLKSRGLLTPEHEGGEKRVKVWEHTREE
jgi:hypothetical protein